MSGSMYQSSPSFAGATYPNVVGQERSVLSPRAQNSLTAEVPHAPAAPIAPSTSGGQTKSELELLIERLYGSRAAEVKEQMKNADIPTPFAEGGSVGGLGGALFPGNPYGAIGGPVVPSVDATSGVVPQAAGGPSLTSDQIKQVQEFLSKQNNLPAPGIPDIRYNEGGDAGSAASSGSDGASAGAAAGGAPDGPADGAGSGGGVGADGGTASGGDSFRTGGLVPLQGGGKIAIGPGGGLDDLIPTSINGRRAAALSDGEFVVPADVVSMMGDGSSNAGSRRLYDLVKQIREAKTGTTSQARPLPVGDILKRTL